MRDSCAACLASSAIRLRQLSRSRSFANELEQRESTFISIARELIYGYPASPYRQLLALAGCEAGDLERLVQAEGVEGALGHLLRRGVYLTVEELKGRLLVRGSASFMIDPRRLHNPAPPIMSRPELVVAEAADAAAD